jgi:hypothetical protein
MHDEAQQDENDEMYDETDEKHYVLLELGRCKQPARYSKNDDFLTKPICVVA